MSILLTTYEKRLRERAQLLGKDLLTLSNGASNLKFSANGEIKPFFGLTTIAWVDRLSPLFQELCFVQRAIQKDLNRAGLGQFFAFLDQAFFHMTICDITASTTPLLAVDVETTVAQIKIAFTDTPTTERVTAQVKGIGLCSTITCLVSFQQVTELQKVKRLEKRIKQTSQVNVRDFLGHITLAYGLTSPGEKIHPLRDVLQSYRQHHFGTLTFSSFDLTCFSNMNNYHILATVDFTNGQIKIHPTPIDCKLSKS